MSEKLENQNESSTSLSKEKKQKNWKKLGISLCGVLVLGSGITYAIGQSDFLKPISSQQVGQSEQPKQKDLLDKAKESENSTKRKNVLKGLAPKSAEKENLLDTTRGNAIHSLPSDSITSTMVEFDRKAKEADQQVTMPKENKVELKDHIGTLFANDFLSKLEEAKPLSSSKEKTDKQKNVDQSAIVDYNELTMLILRGEKLDPALYFTNSYQTFVNELVRAEKLLESQSSTQPQVNMEVTRLQWAMNQLILRGNKAQLVEILKNAEQLSSDSYITSSAEALNQAIQQAQSVVNTLDVTQPQVDEQVAQLESVMSNLIKRGDKTALMALLTEAQKINLNDYTSASVQMFHQVYAEVDKVAKAVDALQSEVDEAVKKLKEAEQQLVKRGDKTALKELLKEAKAIDRELYTTDSLQVLDQEIQETEQVINDKEAIQSTIDQVEGRLRQAMNGLEKLPEIDLDRLRLQKLVNACKELNVEAYTPNSYQVMATALNEAQLLLTDSTSTDEAIKASLTALQEAKAQLIVRADKRVLEGLIQECDTLIEANYTKDSWQVFQSVLTVSKTVQQDLNVSQNQVDNQVKTLQEAKEHLQEVKG